MPKSAYNTLSRKVIPGKAQQAVSTQTWNRSREVRFKRSQRNVRAAMRKSEVTNMNQPPPVLTGIAICFRDYLPYHIPNKYLADTFSPIRLIL